MDHHQDFTPGKPIQLRHGLLRVVAPNPGPMTGPGTNTYVLGTASLTVVDPGPQIEPHIGAVAALGNIEQVLVTHTHRDHSPAARALAQQTGARLLGCSPPNDGPQDTGFVPDRVLVDGETIDVAGFSLSAVATPGHASNHMCYFVHELGWLLTGDHIMGGSTVVIAPPDGDMSAYLRSLERLKRLPLKALLPGHGAMIEQPCGAIDALIRHRLGREAKVLSALNAQTEKTLDELLATVYEDVPTTLHPVAKLSLLAHLQRLESENRAVERDQHWSALAR